VPFIACRTNTQQKLQRFRQQQPLCLQRLPPWTHEDQTQRLSSKILRPPPPPTDRAHTPQPTTTSTNKATAGTRRHTVDAKDARVHYPVHKKPAHQAGPTPPPQREHPGQDHQGGLEKPASRLIPQDSTACHDPSHPPHIRFHTHQQAGQVVLRHREDSQSHSSTIPLVNTTSANHTDGGCAGCVLLRKEVIQPHLPVRLPCYDFVPIASPTFDGSFHKG
jgi:hypothetical protein